MFSILDVMKNILKHFPINRQFIEKILFKNGMTDLTKKINNYLSNIMLEWIISMRKYCYRLSTHYIYIKVFIGSYSHQPRWNYSSRQIALKLRRGGNRIVRDVHHYGRLQSGTGQYAWPRVDDLIFKCRPSAAHACCNKSTLRRLTS